MEEDVELRLHPQLLRPAPGLQTTPSCRRPGRRPRNSVFSCAGGARRPRPRCRLRAFGFQAPEAVASAPLLTRGFGFQLGSPGPRAMEFRAADREQPAHPNLPNPLAPGWGRGRWKRDEGQKSSSYLAPGLSRS